MSFELFSKRLGFTKYALLGAGLLSLCLVSGCEVEKKTVEVEGPAGGATVKKTTTTTVPTAVDITPTKKTTIEVETRKAD